VRKPTDLARSVKFVQAVETFWMDFALLPACSRRPAQHRHLADSKMEACAFGALPDKIGSGQPIAQESAEVRSRAMHDSPDRIAAQSRRSGCEEHDRLLDEFGAAVHAVLELHQQQFSAIVEGDNECERFDLLIHMANEKKQLAKYAYLRHVESHGCSKLDALKQTGA
jgi:hypothetical protein